MEKLDLQDQSLTNEQLKGKFKGLGGNIQWKYLDLTWNKLAEVPDLVNHVKFASLECLLLFHNEIRQVKTENIPSSTKVVNLNHNLVSEFPDFRAVKELQEIKLHCNNISNLDGTTIPPNVHTINLHSNALRQIPKLERTQIKEVKLGNNKISFIDVHHLPRHVERVRLHNNRIREIPDFSVRQQLVGLWLSRNRIQLVDVKHIPHAIHTLNLSDNQIREVPDLRHHAQLKVLWLKNNSIRTVKVDHIPLCIQVVHLGQNWLEEIPNFSRHNQLEELRLQKNMIRQIETDKLPEGISVLDLDKNRIVEVPDLCAHKKMAELKLWGNKLSQLNAEHIPKSVIFLDVDDNMVSSIPDLSNHRKLKEIMFQENKVSEINVKHFPKDVELIGLGNNSIGEMPDFSTYEHLKELRLWANKISVVNVKHIPKNIAIINFHQNQIKEFPKFSRTKNEQVKEIGMQNNQLTEFDQKDIPLKTEIIDLCNNLISRVPSLKELIDLKQVRLSNNKIQRLEPDKWPQSIQVINVNNNQLRDIENLSKLKKLRALSVAENKIKEVKQENLPNRLHTLNLNKNDITSFPDLRSCMDLKKIFICGNQISLVDAKMVPRSTCVLDIGENKLSKVPDLRNHGMLQELKMTKNSIKEIQNTHIPFCIEVLDVSFNDVETFPDVSRFERLKELNLKKNKISEVQENCIPPFVQSLNLSRNKIKDLPKLLRPDSEMSELNLSENELTSIDPTHIPLTIDSIDVSKNKIKNFPDFSEHTELTFLKLQQNELQNVVVEYVPQKIHTLRVDENKIERFPNLRGHENMTKLTMWGNKISVLEEQDIPISINILDLDRNQISKMPNLTRFYNLENLSLNRNDLQEADGNFFPVNIKNVGLGMNQITKVVNFQKHFLLEEMKLWSNGFTEFDVTQIPKGVKSLLLPRNKVSEIGDLREYEQLEELDLKGNKIKSILGLPMYIKKVILKDNSIDRLEEGCFGSENVYIVLKEQIKNRGLIKPPYEVFSRDFGAVTRYFSETELELGSNNRLVLLGPTEAGKSSLAETLRSGKSTLVDIRDRTEVVDVKPWKISENHTYVIYDHGGHKIYSVTSPLFISKKSIILLLHDVNKIEEQDIKLTTDILRQTLQQHAINDLHVVFTKLDVPEGLTRDEIEQRLEPVKKSIEQVIESEAKNLKAYVDSHLLKQKDAEDKVSENNHAQDKIAKEGYEGEVLHEVSTKQDSKLADAKEKSQVLESRKDNMKYFDTSCQSKEGIDKLQNFLEDEAKRKEVRIPKKWQKLIVWINSESENYLKTKKVRKKFSTFSNIFFDRWKIFQRKNFRQSFKDVLDYLSDAGIALHYDSPELQEHVFHNVTFLHRLFKSVFHHSNSETVLDFERNPRVRHEFSKSKETGFEKAILQYSKKGLLDTRLLSVLWEKYNLKRIEKSTFVDLMKKFDLCQCDSDNSLLFVPWLVADECRDRDIEINMPGKFDSEHMSVQENWKFLYSIPQNAFEKVCVWILNKIGEVNLKEDGNAWKNGVFVEIQSKQIECLVFRNNKDEGSTISVRLQAKVKRLKDIWDKMEEIHNWLESILEPWQYLLQSCTFWCGHCCIRKLLRMAGKQTKVCDIEENDADIVFGAAKDNYDTIQCPKESASQIPVALMYAQKGNDTKAVEDYLEKQFKDFTDISFVLCLYAHGEYTIVWNLNITTVVVKIELANEQCERKEASGSYEEYKLKDLGSEVSRFGITAKSMVGLGKFTYAEPLSIQERDITEADTYLFDHECHSIHDSVNETDLCTLEPVLKNRGLVPKGKVGKSINKPVKEALNIFLERVYSRKCYKDACLWKVALHQIGYPELAKLIPVRDKEDELIVLPEL